MQFFNKLNATVFRNYIRPSDLSPAILISYTYKEVAVVAKEEESELALCCPFASSFGVRAAQLSAPNPLTKTSIPIGDPLFLINTTVR